MCRCLERAADRSAADASSDRFAIADALARIASLNRSETGSGLSTAAGLPAASTVTAVKGRGTGDLIDRLEVLVAGDERKSLHGWSRMVLLVAGALVTLGIFASSALAVAGSDHREAFICYTQHMQGAGPEDVCESGHPFH